VTIKIVPHNVIGYYKNDIAVHFVYSNFIYYIFVFYRHSHDIGWVI